MEVVRSAEKTIRRHAKKQNKPCEYSCSQQAERFTEYFRRPLKMNHSFVSAFRLIFTSFCLIAWVSSHKSETPRVRKLILIPMRLKINNK